MSNPHHATTNRGIRQRRLLKISRKDHCSNHPERTRPASRTARQLAEPTAAITGMADPSGAIPVLCAGGGGGGPVSLPSGFSLPPDTPPAAATAIMWALGQLGTPYHLNGDCTAAYSGDPAHQCDCSFVVISSATILRACDLRFRVEDGVVDTVVAGVFADQRSGGLSPRRDAVRSPGPVGVVRPVPEDALALGAAAR